MKVIDDIRIEIARATDKFPTWPSEAIQTAAMAIRFAMSLDRYDYGCCEQHEQRIYGWPLPLR